MSAQDCPGCAGDGWYIGHEEDCYAIGDCICSGVPIRCEECGGSGLAPVLSVGESSDEEPAA